MSANRHLLHCRLEGTIIIIGLRLRLEYMVGQWASTQVPLSRDDISNLFIFLSAALHPISIPQPLYISVTEAHWVISVCMCQGMSTAPSYKRTTLYFYHGNSTICWGHSPGFLTYLLVLSTIFLISWKCINWTSDHLGAPSRLASLQRQKKL